MGFGRKSAVKDSSSSSSQPKLLNGSARGSVHSMGSPGTSPRVFLPGAAASTVRSDHSIARGSFGSSRSSLVSASTATLSEAMKGVPNLAPPAHSSTGLGTLETSTPRSNAATIGARTPRSAMSDVRHVMRESAYIPLDKARAKVKEVVEQVLANKTAQMDIVEDLERSFQTIQSETKSYYVTFIDKLQKRVKDKSATQKRLLSTAQEELATAKAEHEKALVSLRERVKAVSAEHAASLESNKATIAALEEEKDAAERRAESAQKEAEAAAQLTIAQQVQERIDEVKKDLQDTHEAQLEELRSSVEEAKEAEKRAIQAKEDADLIAKTTSADQQASSDTTDLALKAAQEQIDLLKAELAASKEAGSGVSAESTSEVKESEDSPDAGPLLKALRAELEQVKAEKQQVEAALAKAETNQGSDALVAVSAESTQLHASAPASDDASQSVDAAQAEAMQNEIAKLRATLSSKTERIGTIEASLATAEASVASAERKSAAQELELTELQRRLDEVTAQYKASLTAAAAVASGPPTGPRGADAPGDVAEGSDVSPTIDADDVAAKEKAVADATAAAKDAHKKRKAKKAELVKWFDEFKAKEGRDPTKAEKAVVKPLHAEYKALEAEASAADAAAETAVKVLEAAKAGAASSSSPAGNSDSKAATTSAVEASSETSEALRAAQAELAAMRLAKLEWDQSMDDSRKEMRDAHSKEMEALMSKHQDELAAARKSAESEAAEATALHSSQGEEVKALQAQHAQAMRDKDQQLAELKATLTKVRREGASESSGAEALEELQAQLSAAEAQAQQSKSERDALAEELETAKREAGEATAAAEAALEDAKSELEALKAAEPGSGSGSVSKGGPDKATLAKISSLEKSVERLKTEKEGLAKKLKEASSKSGSGAKEASDAARQVKELTSELKKTQDRVGKAENRAKKLEEDLSKAKEAAKASGAGASKVKALETKMAKAEAEAQSREEKLTKEWEKKVAETENRARKEKEAALAAAEKKASAASGDATKLAKELATRNDELSKAQEALAIAKAENKGLSAAKEDLEKNLAAVEGAAAASAEAAAKAAEAGEALESLQKEHASLEKSYREEQVLRKKYYNTIEDMKGKIRVYARCRPMSKKELARGCKGIITIPDEYTCDVATAKGSRPFQYDAVFGADSTQEQVYADCSRLVQSAVDGYNVCIFAYGQTGSGKTYTMSGVEGNLGITPRAMKDIFAVLKEGEGKFSFTVSVYMLELYNDGLVDLLIDKTKPGAKAAKLDIKKNAKGMVYVPNARVVEVDTAESMEALFNVGLGARHVSATDMNAESSRSHLVFSVLIRTTNSKTGNVSEGKLSLVDLAGSERVSKTNATEKLLKEAMSINKSLTCLGDVISALSSGESFIPYRNNKLTMLMQDSLGGNAKTLMFVNISPADYNTDETTQSLTYASRVKLITNDASKNAESKEVARLKKIISKLKKAGAVIPDDEDEEEAAAE